MGVWRFDGRRGLDWVCGFWLNLGARASSFSGCHFHWLLCIASIQKHRIHGRRLHESRKLHRMYASFDYFRLSRLGTIPYRYRSLFHAFPYLRLANHNIETNWTTSVFSLEVREVGIGRAESTANFHAGLALGNEARTRIDHVCISRRKNGGRTWRARSRRRLVLIGGPVGSTRVEGVTGEGEVTTTVVNVW